MKTSFASRSFFLITTILCISIFSSANANDNQATDPAIINNDDKTDDDVSPDGTRFIQTAKLAVANVKRDLTVPEQYFLQGCLRKALETTEHQNNLVTLEVIDSTSLSPSDEEQHQNLRSLTDWSWLYSYDIFFEYDRDCYYDDYICNSGGRRRLGGKKQQQHRIERYVCKHLRRGPYPVFHSADDCHVVFADAA